MKILGYNPLMDFATVLRQIVCGWCAVLGTNEDLGILPYNVYIR